MSKQLSKKEQLREEKRQRILNAAITLFSKNGYSETTIAAVAKGSEVSFGTVFTYFPNKEQLFEAAVLEPLNEIKPLFLCQINKDQTPLEHLKQMVKEHVITFSQKETHLRLVQYVLGQHERFPKIFEQLDSFFHDVIDALEPIIIEGQKQGELHTLNPEIVATSYFQFLNGIRVTIIDPPDGIIWKALIPQALLLFAPVNSKDIYDSTLNE
ncbi:TetR/AcrR family transcriptional regulator [Cytobacillus sp. Hm23]